MTKITQLGFAFILFISSIAFANLSYGSNAKGQNYQTASIQRLRINITTPQGYTRQLLLGFTSDNVATDGVDYGYDALNIENLPDDMNWMIQNKRYIIQGVGAFDLTKSYPLGLFLSNSGSVKISLYSLENFQTDIDVYIYDSVLNTYTKINDKYFEQVMSNGEHLDRFYIAFQNKDIEQKKVLSAQEVLIENTDVRYLKNTKELYINTNGTQNIKSVKVYNVLGKELFSLKNVNSNKLKVPIEYINTQFGIVSVTTEQSVVSKKILFK